MPQTKSNNSTFGTWVHKQCIMTSKELEQLRFEIAKCHYVKHLYSTALNDYENLARKSFELADVFVKVYEETTKGTAIPASAYMKGGE